MIKTTHPISYGAASKDKGCSTECDSSQWFYGFCKIWTALSCAFVSGGSTVKDTVDSADTISKLLPMFAVLLIIGLAIGFSRGRISPISLRTP